MLLQNPRLIRRGDACLPFQNFRNAPLINQNVNQHFRCGFLLKDKFRIEKLVGHGGFGQIYKAVDVEFNLTVAIKVGLRSRDPARMILEQKVLLALSNTDHSPALLASGTYGDFMYIVMELLGKNLTDLRKNRPMRRFSIGTSLRIGQQCVDALKAIHDISFLHRDIKPSNICIGAEGTDRRRIYIVDFGMTRQFRDTRGNIRSERRYAGFRGTTRYVSLTIHNRQEQGPVDDLWSLLYSLIEVSEGSLPWRLISNPLEVKRMKLDIKIEDMCRNLPKEIIRFANHLDSLSFNETPNYLLLNEILQKLLPKDVKSDAPFDWEESLVQ